MCGIAGFLQLGSSNNDNLETITKAMIRSLEHRGPDDEGIWILNNEGIALAHRRLSILDLSTHGHQPMHSACGRYTVVFNGEIYNHTYIRKDLEKGGQTRWRGHSDTEVLLAAISHMGLDAALDSLVGMFAFALWDHKHKTLTLARDRIGEKPLYYGWSGNVFLFGSELKALRKHPEWNNSIDRDALLLYLTFGYIPAPHTIYENIYKLRPGTSISVNHNTGHGQRTRPKEYWSLKSVAEKFTSDPFTGTTEEAISQIEALLGKSISQQMIADVPVGAMLSGGIDSSIVTALMQEQSHAPINTFTVGFSAQDYNEAVHAKRIAEYLGTSHTELYVTPAEAQSVIPDLPVLYDEPFSDSSQIPSILISKLARTKVTACLSGDGGDELFGGYYHYIWADTLLRKTGFIPYYARNVLSRSIQSISTKNWGRLAGIAKPLVTRLPRSGITGDTMHKLAEILDYHRPEDIYLRLVSLWKQPQNIVLGKRQANALKTFTQCHADIEGFIPQMMYMDSMRYLPDDILVKIDRASMGVGLELRAPFLDHRIIEFSWRIPIQMKVNNGSGKWIVKQLLYKHLPKELIDRPKLGFSVPLDSWLRGPLREWAEDLLQPQRIKQEGFFNPEPITKKWNEHATGQHNWQNYLWAVLMFQSWLQENQKT